MKLAPLVKESMQAIELTEISQRAKNLVDGYELEDLERNLEQVYRDMEEEAEPEGGPIADQYADEIHAYDEAIRFIKNKGSEKAQRAVGSGPDDEMTYDDMIKKHYGKSPTGVLPSGKPKFGESLNEATDDEIAQALYSVDYDELEPDEKERVDDVQDEMGDTLLNESTESKWNAVDVSRTAEKELSNREWNERTAKKLAILKSLNTAGKFKKDWDEEKLQGWVDQNYSWEKLSQQFKNIGEGTCGYGKDGKVNPRDTSKLTPGGLKSMPADKRTTTMMRETIKRLIKKIHENK